MLARRVRIIQEPQSQPAGQKLRVGLVLDIETAMRRGKPVSAFVIFLVRQPPRHDLALFPPGLRLAGTIGRMVKIASA